MSRSALLGQDLYRIHCSPCHEDNPAGLKKTPPKLKGVFKKATLPDGVPATEETVRAVILQGLRTMPAYNGRLSSEQVSALIAYLHTK